MRAEPAGTLAYLPKIDMGRFPHNKRQSILGLFRGFKSHMEKPLTWIEAHQELRLFNKVHGTNLRIIRPGTADLILNDNTGNWRFVRHCAPFLTSLVAGYERPARPLGEHIVFAEPDEPRIILPTHSRRGQIGIALAAEITAEDIRKNRNGDIELEVPESRLMAVEIPGTRRGCVIRTTALVGQKEDGETAREIIMLEDSPYIGPEVRDTGIYQYRRSISLCYPPSFKLGVVVEISEDDARRFGQRIAKGAMPPEKTRTPNIKGRLPAELRDPPERMQAPLKAVEMAREEDELGLALENIRELLPARIRRYFDAAVAAVMQRRNRG